MQSRTKNYLLIGLLLVIWLITSACSCSGLFQGASRLRKNLSAPTATATEATLSEEQTATPLPSPTATVTATLAVTPSPTTRPPATPLRIPNSPGQSFDIRLTQQEINDYLQGQTFEQQGVTVRDIDVHIDTERITATFHVAHAESGMSGGVTVYGVPRVADGQLYVEIQDFALDKSVSGFKRIVANSLIKAALEEYSTSYGIPVPVNDLIFETVQLMSEAIRVTGHTR